MQCARILWPTGEMVAASLPAVIANGAVLGIVARAAALPPATGAPDLEVQGSTPPAPDTGYYEQTLDHFSPVDNRTWSQRYLFSNTSWDGSGELPNGCRGPVLLYTGNEGPIDEFYSGNGFVTEVLAPALGAFTLFIEERYYGESLPFGDSTWNTSSPSYDAANLRYLTTEQVLADYNVLVQDLKSATPGMENCPVVAFGGSYGATLSTFFRLAYPNTVVGALAASAPTGYYDSQAWPQYDVDDFTWSSIVVDTYLSAGGQPCLDAINSAVAAIGATPVDQLVEAFNVCNASGLGPTTNADLFTYTLEGYPQLDYPCPVPPLPAKPATAACVVLTEAAANGTNEALISAAAEVTTWGQGNPDGSCIQTLPEGPGDVPGDGPGPGAWGYQSCTQTLHPFSSSTLDGRGLRNFSFVLADEEAVCDQNFNSTVSPDLEALTRTYGGYTIPANMMGITNIIWSNGTPKIH